MFKRMAMFWRDERGFVPATEWMLVASILTLGTIAAMLSSHPTEEPDDDSPPALVCVLD